MERFAVEGVLLDQHDAWLTCANGRTAISHATHRRELRNVLVRIRCRSFSPLLLRLGVFRSPLLGQYIVSLLKGTDPIGGFCCARAKSFVCFPSRFRMLDYCVCVCVLFMFSRSFDTV